SGYEQHHYRIRDITARRFGKRRQEVQQTLGHSHLADSVDRINDEKHLFVSAELHFVEDSGKKDWNQEGDRESGGPPAHQLKRWQKSGIAPVGGARVHSVAHGRRAPALSAICFAATISPTRMYGNQLHEKPPERPHMTKPQRATSKPIA